MHTLDCFSLYQFSCMSTRHQHFTTVVVLANNSPHTKEEIPFPFYPSVLARSSAPS